MDHAADRAAGGVLILDLDRAWRVVREHLPVTPLWTMPTEDGRDAPVFVKLESLQETGSFKVRGALVKVASLTPEERARGVVTCSSGNHGRAVAWVCERLGVRAVVCVPEWVDPVKLEAIRAHGAEAVVEGATYDEAARRSVELAEQDGLVPVHPFDDPLVAAGQATIALEILEQCPDVARVVVPLSGGGLAGGVAYALAHRAPDRVEVVAASARRARVMWESLRAGHPVELPEESTVASALSGGIELDNRLTFALVRDLVHRHVVVDEEAILGAMRWAVGRGLVVEGGGAVSLAALGDESGLQPDGPTVVIVSGGNVGLETLASLLDGPR